MKSNFNSHDPDAIVATIAQALRQELAIEARLGCRIERNPADHSATGAHFADYATMVVGGRPSVLFRAHFTVPMPRPFAVQANILREGGGSYVGGLLFSTSIAKSIVAGVELSDVKVFGGPEFAGDPVAATNLNLNKDLLRQAGAFASRYTNGRLSTRRLLKIVPDCDHAALYASVLPKPDMLGFSFNVTLGAKEFCALAAQIERVL